MLVTISLLVACVIVAAVAVPLMLRLIPPNPLYGVCTERTLTQQSTWFEVNAFGGRALLIAAGIAALLIMVYQGTWLRSGWAQLAVFVIAIVAAIASTLVFERKLPRRAPRRE
jgi:membrane-associated PAP2 superfamily phosphatase